MKKEDKDIFVQDRDNKYEAEKNFDLIAFYITTGIISVVFIAIIIASLFS